MKDSKGFRPGGEATMYPGHWATKKGTLPAIVNAEFVDELPRLPTGKLYKRVLRDKYRAE